MRSSGNSDHNPDSEGDTLHGAACHACLFAPETSCERGNRLKDVIESIRLGIEGEPGSTTPPPGAPPFVWLLLPSDELDLGPRLDGQTVPVLTPAYWRAIPPYFLRAALPSKDAAVPSSATAVSSATPHATSPKPARAPRKRRSS